MLSSKKFLVPGALVASLLVAACGSSSNSNSNPPANNSSSGSPGLTIGTANGSIGTYLVGASGRALYLWVADSSGKSACSGACASVWPPLTASSLPHVSGGVVSSELSLIARTGGAKQVAYKGHPLYYYASDTGAGMTSGQGSNSFGAKWWLVAPSGGQITKASATPVSTGY